MMENKEVQDMFSRFNQKYFWGKLDRVKLCWSKNMTLCAGKTYCRERQGSYSCSISLSEPLLSQRPPEDTVNTLLHEMIHAYLFLTERSNHKMGHGPQFKEHMTRINKLHGSKITVFHNFRKEVDKFRVNVYHCDGPCKKKRPYFGTIRRAITRPPGPTDRWWAKHSQECGGTFHKVEGPDISPNTGHNTHKPQRASPAYSAGTPSPKNTPSPRRMDSTGTQSSGALVKGSRGNNSEYMSGVRKRLAFDREKNKDDSTFAEDQVIQTIRKRHAHTSRSILLPPKETKMEWREPGSERVTLVEGRVNYNYKIKSGFKFNIHKYLERYRAVKEIETGTSQKTKVSQRLQVTPDAQKLTRLQPTGAHTSRTETTKVSQASLVDQTCTSSLRTSGSSHATVPPVVPCWNCGVNVMVPEHVQHSQKVPKEESFCDTPINSSQGRKRDSESNVSLTLVPCPSCGEKIPKEEINSHLDECLTPFTDDF